MSSVEMNLVSWMRQDALPFWVSQGVDWKRGGFIEELNPDGSPSDVPFKRVRVQGRQLFSFATAALLGWHAEAGAISDHGFSFLKNNCKSADGHWFRKLSSDGTVIDTEMDLYDVSFVLLGLAAYYRLTQNPEALELMGKTLRMVQTEMVPISKIGYQQSSSDTQVLRQNPHMHWFETMLFCFEATRDANFLEEAERIYNLAEKYIIDEKTGALRELFDPYWNPIYENGKILVEPGHHYEWAWLLTRASRHMKINKDLISHLLDFADRMGVNPLTFLVYDQISLEGEVTQPTHRLWVQTEALKAWLVRPDKNEFEKKLGTEKIEKNLLHYYLNRKPMGSWCDRLDAGGRVHDTPTPASSLYHILLSITELSSWRSERGQIK